MSHIGGAPQGSVASLVARWNNGMQDTQDGPSSVSQQQQQHKRQRVTATPARLLPADSPALAHSGGAAAAAAAAGERGAGRQLGFDDAQDSSSDVAAREARLEAIRKRFGTKLFLPAHELPPAEQRRQLGAEEADLAPEDYRLRKWEALPVVLSGTSNAWTLNWVLKGQSGCVGVASSLLHLWVLGASQTIFIAHAGAVHAARDEGGVTLSLGPEQGRLGLKVADAAAADDLVSTINLRAAKHSRLRQRAAARGEAADAAQACTAAPDV